MNDQKSDLKSKDIEAAACDAAASASAERSQGDSSPVKVAASSGSIDAVDAVVADADVYADEVAADGRTAAATASADAPAPADEVTAVMPSAPARISPATIQQDGETADSQSAKAHGSRSEERSRRRIAAIAVAILVALAVASGLAYALSSSGQLSDSSQPQQSSPTSSGSSSTASSSEPPSTKSAGAVESSGQTAASDKASESTSTQQDQSSSNREEAAGTAASDPAGEEVAEQTDQGIVYSGGSNSTSSSTSGGSSQSFDSGSSARSTIVVYLGIDSSRAADYGLSGPSASMSLELDEGATVYDALCASGFSLSGSSSYVSAIGGLAEKQCGSGSGWTYAVDGSFPAKACGRYVLSGGESISWIYSTEKDPTMSM